MTDKNILDLTPISYEDDNEIGRIKEFGASKVTKEHIKRFPEPTHRLIRRKVFFAQRGLDDYLSSARGNRRHSIVTGIGPSGPMHIGHIIPLYFAKYMQEQTGATVYIPLSDDEKYLTRDNSMQTIQDYTMQNLKDILAIGFNPSKTRIIIDTVDTDIVYPAGVKFAKNLTNAQVNAVYGDGQNIGEQFYPAVQTMHLMLPQLVYGKHPSMVLAAGDQDPHIRLARDVAGKSEYDLEKPKSLFSRYIPSLKNPMKKMSSSGDEPMIKLSDTHEDIETKIKEKAYSGGQRTLKKHKEIGGEPEKDIPYTLLYFFFEEDDDRLREIYDSYKNGTLLSGELKDETVEKVSAFILSHQARRDALGDISEEINPYRLGKSEKNSILTRMGYGPRPRFE
jgi:tryptophanyl-tRNA synthetase